MFEIIMYERGNQRGYTIGPQYLLDSHANH